MNERLRVEREKVGLTQSQLAVELGVKQQTISRYEQGKRRPSNKYLTKAASYFKVSTDYLLGLTDEESSQSEILHKTYSFDTQISTRIQHLMQEKGITINHLATICNLSLDEINSLLNCGYLPHITVLIQLADYFNTSTDYLLNRSDYRYQIENNEEKSMLTAFRALDMDNRFVILGEAIKEAKNTQGNSYESPFSIMTDSPKE